MTSLLFLTQGACNFFQVYGPPADEWFASLSTSELTLPEVRSESGDMLIFTAQELASLDTADVASIIIDDGELLRGVRSNRKREAFNRVLRIFQSIGDRSTTIPSLWRPYNYDSFISIQATTRLSGAERMLIDRRRTGSIFAVCYGILAANVDFPAVMPELAHISGAMAQLKKLTVKALSEAAQHHPDGEFDLDANNLVLGLGDNLQTWYESKLTAKQRDFVDAPLSKSLRVRGPAGSGKTIAMVVKVLRLVEADRQAKRVRRYAFLTHSQSTVDLVQSMIRTMLSNMELNALNDGSSDVLRLGTLYSYAFDTLGTELRGVTPLSLDGRQGRQMQAEMLHSVMRAYAASDWIARRGGCSADFVERLEDAAASDEKESGFILELLNEFACVIEAEGIIKSPARRSDYVSKSSREPWRLTLATQDERRTVLDLHREFRAQMRQSECISVDQLVSDFERFLGSNAWELTRASSGFDAIFIDELHLLNRLERMMVLSLTKDAESKPVVVMAEDVKQDARRLSFGLRNWQGQFEQVENFEFTDVFRYTPQINAFLRSIDDFAPTLHLDEDWPQYGQVSRLPDGPRPMAATFASAKEQYEAVFKNAASCARKKKNGRLVAVLGCDYENFKLYLQAGQHKSQFIAVESRDDIASIPNRGLKFVFSMPEFVAGLQFEDVYLLDVNNALFTDGEAAGVQDKRRALSTIYLGASRAMRTLHLSSLTTSGGPPACINHAVEAGTVERT